jgi:hypothetical protein
MDEIDWHPAFFAAIQLDLDEYRDVLEFTPEHQLTDRPLRIDVVIIKKAPGAVIRKGIAEIFKTHNIVEYKSPAVSLSVKDFYKVYAYACLYVSQGKADIQDVTLTFVVTKRPEKLLKHLREVKKCSAKKTHNGIYVVGGDMLPIQIIVTKELSEEESEWIKNLRPEVGQAAAETILEDAQQRENQFPLVKAYLGIFMRVNADAVEEVFMRKDEDFEAMMRRLGYIIPERVEAERRQWQKQEKQWQAREKQLLEERQELLNRLNKYEGKSGQ